MYSDETVSQRGCTKSQEVNKDETLPADVTYDYSIIKLSWALCTYPRDGFGRNRPGFWKLFRLSGKLCPFSSVVMTIRDNFESIRSKAFIEWLVIFKGLAHISFHLIFKMML